MTWEVDEEKEDVKKVLGRRVRLIEVNRCPPSGEGGETAPRTFKPSTLVGRGRPRTQTAIGKEKRRTQISDGLGFAISRTE